ncbi:hypothetical protein [Streptococcus gallinaceus]|uniref:tRNA(Phe) wybutosine-synthesizing methylase Tyw3 n=1 Tax=Streptococcus gallinaceus TaxID=165758 RepID=A0ABV2JMS3_9STRE
MKKVEVLVLLACTSLLVIACSNEKKETGMEASRQSSVVKNVDSSSSSDSKVRSDNQLQVAEDFMQTYIEQSIDLVKLKEKEKALKGYRGDSSLDSAIQSVSSLQVEVVDYQKTKEI